MTKNVVHLNEIATPIFHSQTHYSVLTELTNGMHPDSLPFQMSDRSHLDDSKPMLPISPSLNREPVYLYTQ